MYMLTMLHVKCLYPHGILLHMQQQLATGWSHPELLLHMHFLTCNFFTCSNSLLLDGHALIISLTQHSPHTLLRCICLKYEFSHKVSCPYVWHGSPFKCWKALSQLLVSNWFGALSSVNGNAKKALFGINFLLPTNLFLLVGLGNSCIASNLPTSGLTTPFPTK